MKSGVAPQFVSYSRQRVTEGGPRLDIPRRLPGQDLPALSQTVGQQHHQRIQAEERRGGAGDGLRRPLALRLDAQMFAHLAVGDLNGLITNDKFCYARQAHLTLSWWRKPLQDRKSADRTSTAKSCGGDDEARVAETTGVDRTPRCATALGSSVPVADVLDRGGANASPDPTSDSVSGGRPCRTE